MPAKDRDRDKERDKRSDARDSRRAAEKLPQPHGPAAGSNGAVTVSASSPAAPPAFAPRAVAARVMEQFAAAADEPGVGGPFRPDPMAAGAVAFTHFDSPSSEDNAITILLPRDNMARLPAQALVRIRSRRDDPAAERQAADDPAVVGTAASPEPARPPEADRSPGDPRPFRDYVGVVVAGPFAEPDGLRADSSIVVASTVSGHGQVFLPRYHGRALVQILGEIDTDADNAAAERPVAAPAPAAERAAAAGPTATATDRLIPPQYRPRPNSPVFPLDDDQTARFLKAGGDSPADARVGVMIGRERVAVSIPTDRKHVLPRHTGILGTTGSGKSTTVAALVHRLQQAGVATVLIDVEGEYTEIDRPTEDEAMLAALRRRGLAAAGVKDLHVLHPVGRETSRDEGAASKPGRTHAFSLQFSELSPHAAAEILDMPEPQQERFAKCFEATRALLRDLRVFPATREEEDQLAQLDELETGYPRMTLSHLIDVAGVFAHSIAKDEGEVPLFNEVFAANRGKVREKVAQFKSSHEFSWRGLIGRLWRVHRLRIFDNPAAPPLRYGGFLEPGRVSVVDLSDTDEPQVRNLVIADVLRGIQRAQEDRVAEALAAGRKPTPVVVIIEEAHEFLSAQRLRQMPTLFQQVARIARRGRKRWLGLTFVTQLPQHLPDEVLGLINNWIIHKISDAGVVDRLRKSIAGLDRAQWNAVAGLAPGQAVVSLTSLTRPLMVSVDPTPCRLRMTD